MKLVNILMQQELMLFRMPKDFLLVRGNHKDLLMEWITNKLLIKLRLLATDGMLVKRPLVIGEGFVLVGFKESEWSEKL